MPYEYRHMQICIYTHLTRPRGAGRCKIETHTCWMGPLHTLSCHLKGRYGLLVLQPLKLHFREGFSNCVWFVLCSKHCWKETEARATGSIHFGLAVIQNFGEAGRKIYPNSRLDLSLAIFLTLHVCICACVRVSLCMHMCV